MLPARPLPWSLTVLVLAVCCGPARAEDKPVRVTVIAVLATKDNNVVNPKLTELAKEVQKRDASLVGYKIGAAACASIPVGQSANLSLVEKQELKVTVNKPRGEDGRITLTIKPPHLGEITYACACSKFFPVVTPYKTADGQVLILAVMAKPCTLAKKADEKK